MERSFIPRSVPLIEVMEPSLSTRSEPLQEVTTLRERSFTSRSILPKEVKQVSERNLMPKVTYLAGGEKLTTARILIVLLSSFQFHG